MLFKRRSRTFKGNGPLVIGGNPSSARPRPSYGSSIQRAKFGKYDLPMLQKRSYRWVLGIPLALLAFWIIWESIEALRIFD